MVWTPEPKGWHQKLSQINNLQRHAQASYKAGINCLRQRCSYVGSVIMHSHELTHFSSQKRHTVVIWKTLFLTLIIVIVTVLHVMAPNLVDSEWSCNSLFVCLFVLSLQQFGDVRNRKRLVILSSLCIDTTSWPHLQHEWWYASCSHHYSCWNC